MRITRQYYHKGEYANNFKNNTKNYNAWQQKKIYNNNINRVINNIKRVQIKNVFNYYMHLKLKRKARQLPGIAKKNIKLA